MLLFGLDCQPFMLLIYIVCDCFHCLCKQFPAEHSSDAARKRARGLHGVMWGCPCVTSCFCYTAILGRKIGKQPAMGQQTDKHSSGLTGTTPFATQPGCLLSSISDFAGPPHSSSLLSGDASCIRTSGQAADKYQLGTSTLCSCAVLTYAPPSSSCTQSMIEQFWLLKQQFTKCRGF